MSNNLNYVLYNLDPNSSQELTSNLATLSFLRRKGEVTSPESLAEILQENEINLVFFHLDPECAPVLEVIEQVSTRFPDLPMIALSHDTHPEAILGPMRAGCDQFVCEPIDHADLAAAVARIASKRLISGTQCRRICVTGGSGGAGTTSLAANLALEIGHLTDRGCALVDLDLQFGDLAVNFDIEPKYTIFDLAVSGPEVDKSMLVGSMCSLPENVSLLARPREIGQDEQVTPETIHRVIELLGGVYENIVVDIPREVSARTLAAFTQADTVLIVCQMIVPGIRNAKRYYDALVQGGVDGDRIHYVVNRYSGNSGRMNIKDVEAVIKQPVYTRIPSDYEFVAQSLDLGQPIASDDKKNPVRSAICAMAEQIIGDGSAESVSVKTPKKGLLGRLLSR